MKRKVIIVGSGNAALCAGIAALEQKARVIILEKADKELSGGNTKYTAGAMRFAYNNDEDIKQLLKNPDDERLLITDFGEYTEENFSNDLLSFNNGKSLTKEQRTLVSQSYDTIKWLTSKGIKFEPIYERQSFKKDGKFIFWGGLTLASHNEGVGLFEQELEVFLNMGGEIFYKNSVESLIFKEKKIIGVKTSTKNFYGDSIILASGGFEANKEMRKKYLGNHWKFAKVRGTPNNTGDGLKMALDAGAIFHGNYASCHATPMDLHMKEYKILIWN